jgi:hypothetical protein
MKTVRARNMLPLVFLCCAFLLSGISLADSSSTELPSNANYSTLIRFSSAAGKSQIPSRQSIMIVGEAVVVTQAETATTQTQSGLLAILLFLTAVDGDLNRDRQVNSLDLFLFQKFWQEILQEEIPSVVGDFDRNDIVNHQDLLLFLQYWNSQKRNSLSPSHSTHSDKVSDQPQKAKNKSPNLDRGTKR